MDTSDHITHQGVVINRIDDKAIIYVMQADSCHSCSMKAFCGVEDEDRSRFEVSDSSLAIGDHVNIQISPGNGFKATFWAYLFPFLLMIAVIFTGTFLQLSEALLGSAALLLLIPYYLVLAHFRKNLSRQVHLHITKL